MYGFSETAQTHPQKFVKTTRYNTMNKDLKTTVVHKGVININKKGENGSDKLPLFDVVHNN